MDLVWKMELWLALKFSRWIAKDLSNVTLNLGENFVYVAFSGNSGGLSHTSAPSSNTILGIEFQV